VNFSGADDNTKVASGKAEKICFNKWASPSTWKETVTDRIHDVSVDNIKQELFPLEQ
jgi:hypothetical protein